MTRSGSAHARERALSVDLETLFEGRKPPTALYRTRAAEIEAVASGKKAVARYDFFAPRLLDDRDAHAYLETLLHAFERGLLVVVHPWPARPYSELGFNVYVTRPGELWRVPALLVLDEEGGAVPTDNVTEMYRSILLGYTKEQRRTWLAEVEQRAYWRNATYVLLTRAQATRVRALGGRGFDDVHELTFFRHRAGQLRRDVLKRVPRGYTLAAFDHASSALVFPEWTTRPRRRGHLFTGQVRAREAAAFHAGLRTKIRFLGATGWR